MQNGVCVNLAAGATTSSCPSGVANGSGGCMATQPTCSAGQAMQNGVCVNLAAGAATSSCPSGVANGSGGCTGTMLSVGPVSRDFGSVRSGAASTAFMFTVVNGSTGSVSGISVAVSGVNASSFTIASNTCGGGLAAGGTCAVGVRFSPSSVGVNTASLDVTATSSGSARASLTGTAIP